MRMVPKLVSFYQGTFDIIAKKLSKIPSFIEKPVLKNKYF